MKKKCDPAYIFILVAAVGILGSLCVLLLTKGSAWPSILFASGADSFMDFFNHIAYVKNPSETYFVSFNACFPAFAYMFYYLLWCILPEGSVTLWAASETSGTALLVYIIYTVLLTLLTVKVIKKYTEKLSALQTSLIVISLLLSYPFVCGVFERGNSVSIVLILLMTAMLWKDSDEKLKREAALLLIAFAFGFKVYPALFGIFYLLEKRFKEAIRLAIYGILTFLLPFGFFGGLAGLKQFFVNQTILHNTFYASISFQGLFAPILANFGIAEGNAHLIVTVFTAIFICVSLIAIIKSKYAFLKILFLVNIMVFCPNWSGSYTLVYYALPFVMFIKEEPKISRSMSVLFYVGFALVFCMTVLPITQASRLSFLVNCLGAAALFFVAFIETFHPHRRDETLKAL